MCALVTGVQTCALPIYAYAMPELPQLRIVESGDVLVAHPDRTLRWPLQQVEHADQGAFTSTRATDNAKYLALPDMQVHPGQRMRNAPRGLIGFTDIF